MVMKNTEVGQYCLHCIQITSIENLVPRATNETIGAEWP